MAHGLYELEPEFRAIVDHCADVLTPTLGVDIRDVLFGSDGRLNETWLTHPALFAVEYALARLWMSWGITPSALIGHSFGEYVAACLAGVFSLDDGLALVAERGRLMHGLPGGGMLAVNLGADELRALLPDTLALAAINSPSACVVSGPAPEVDRFEQQLTVEHRRLPIQHASHSACMASAVESLVAAFQRVALSPPRVPYLSNLSGTWIDAAAATDPTYWGRHLVQTVQFADGLRELCSDERRMLIEVGPGRSLAAFVRQTRAGTTVLPSLRHPLDAQSDQAFLMHSLGRACVAGASVDWTAFWAGERRRRVSLPTYPFERQRYWIEPHGSVSALPSSAAPVQHERPTLASAYAAPTSPLETDLAAIWASLLGVDRVGIHDNFFELGGDSLLAVQLTTRVRDLTGIELQLQHLVEAPTVAGTARLLVQIREQSRPAPSRSPVVTITPLGGGVPFFCVHPAGGTVLCYLELARALGPRQPFVALQSPGLCGEAEPSTIELAAARYVAQLRAVQRAGPYRIGGLSYGGNVAFEMARLLHADGEEVDLLAMFDSHPPQAYHTDPPADASYVQAFPSILQMYSGQVPHISGDEIRQLDAPAQVDYMVRQIRASHVLPAEVDDEGIKLLFGLWKTHLLALRAHRPAPLRHAQRITYFRAAEAQPPDLPRLLHIDLRDDGAAWAAFTPGTFEVHTVPGSHYTMLNAAHSGALAPTLASALQREVMGVR
jgi:thioesterase domain-containing protein/acyl carrier protein